LPRAAQRGLLVVRLQEFSPMSMFDALKNVNLGDLLGQVKQMREQAEKLQEELGRREVTADAGGGMVQATVNGKMQLVRLKIDKTRIDTSDTEMLEDVVIAAVQGAQTRAAEMVKQEMTRYAGQLGLPPGLLGG
jgi:DNA-binding YbaB/EbfC family protein